MLAAKVTNATAPDAIANPALAVPMRSRRNSGPIFAVDARSTPGRAIHGFRVSGQRVGEWVVDADWWDGRRHR